MDAPTVESLATMLSASLSTPGLSPIIDAKQAAALLTCSQRHIETLLESGQLDGFAGRCTLGDYAEPQGILRPSLGSTPSWAPTWI
jgi:hypothetical protein